MEVNHSCSVVNLYFPFWDHGSAGASPSRSPMKPMPLTLKRPHLTLAHQPRSHRILPHILPLLRITLPPSQSRIPVMRLPTPTPSRREPPKTALPKTDPSVQRNIQSLWRTRKMHMIRHQHIASHPPRIGFLPCGKQRGAPFRRPTTLPDPSNRPSEKQSSEPRGQYAPHAPGFDVRSHPYRAA